MAFNRRVWPPDYERAEEALVGQLVSLQQRGRECGAKWDTEEGFRALTRILLAWPVAT
jgi:hypothetical protein